MNKINVKINDIDFSGWQSLELTRSIDAMSGAFNLTATDLEEPWLTGVLRAGAKIDILIDDILVLRGYVDNVENKYDANGSSIAITGRDRVSDLLDCAAVVDGAHEYKDQTLDTVIKAILKPYEIELTVSTDVGDKFTRIAVNVGETAFELISRICRYRGVLPVSDGVGGLHLIKPATQDVGVSLIYGENILEASASMDYRDLFSEYVFKAQAEATSFTTPEESASPTGRAKDDKVNRYRPHVEIAEMQGYSQTLQERAEWQKKFNRANALRVSCSVQGLYSKENGKLWMPNTMVHVKCPKLMLDRTMLIRTVSISRDNGTRTKLDMVMPSAFNLPAMKEPEQEDIWGAI